MKSAHVRPTGGRKIRVPERPSQILPAEGIVVPLTDYWLGRLADGDVEMAPPEKKPAPRKAAAKAPIAPQE